MEKENKLPPKELKAGLQTDQRKSNFLKNYRRFSVIGKAASAAGIGRQMFNQWLEEDEGFRADFQDAHQEIVEMLEAEAIRRACQRLEKKVYHGGQELTTKTKYSDALLMFLLKALDPKYRGKSGTSLRGDSRRTIEPVVKVTDA